MLNINYMFVERAVELVARADEFLESEGVVMLTTIGIQS